MLTEKETGGGVTGCILACALIWDHLCSLACSSLQQNRLRTDCGNSLSRQINVCFGLGGHLDILSEEEKSICQDKVVGFVFILSSLLTDPIQISLFYLAIVGNCMFSCILGLKFFGVIAHSFLLLCGIVEFCNKLALRVSVFSVCPLWKYDR